MAEFSVKSKSKLNSASSGMKSSASTVTGIYGTVSTVRSGLVYQGAGYGSIRNSLQRIMDELESEKKSLNAMETGLQNVTIKYWQSETKILENATGKKKSSGNTTNNSGFDMKWKDLFIKGIGTAGIIGKTVSGILTGVTTGWDAKGSLGFAKSMIDVVGQAAKVVKPGVSGSDIWKALIGGSDALAKVTKTSSSAAFGSSFINELGKYNFGNAKTVGEKVATGAKWAGVALSAISNGISNYDEFGTVKSTRFWAETVTETAVDVAIGAGATALVSAAAVAVGITSAPAVAVGAAAVGVVWAADATTRAITKAITGKETKLTELVSDTILDTAEAVGKGVKKVAQSVSKICNVKSITNGMKKLTVKWAF